VLQNGKFFGFDFVFFVVLRGLCVVSYGCADIGVKVL